MPERETRPSLETLPSKVTYLKAHELFQDFTRTELESFHHTIQMSSCAAGHVFYRPGDPGEVMFLVKQGSAQLYRMAPDGRKLVFAHVPTFSMFGEMTCIGQAMYDCFAEAVDDAIICTLTRADVHRLILQYPKFAVRLLEIVGRRMAGLERQLEAVAFKAVVPRLAAFLTEEARAGVVEGLSHQDIADRLGVHRETVTYALNELKAAGLVEIGRRRIDVRDDARLAAIASG